VLGSQIVVLSHAIIAVVLYLENGGSSVLWQRGAIPMIR